MKQQITYRVLVFLLLVIGGNSLSAFSPEDTLQKPPNSSADTLQVAPATSEEFLQSSGLGTPVSGDQGAMEESGNLFARYATRWVDRFDKSPVFISILYAVIFYSILTLVILLIIILLNRNRMQREKEQREYLMERYQEILMDYLFDEIKRPASQEELKLIAINPFNRQILINQMIDLSINLKGEIKDDIRELYLKLGLKRDSLQKAYSRKWHKNVKGFRELAFMNIRDATDKIMECLNSPNDILRMEAQIAMVALSDENPYYFLDFMEKPFSLWEQVTLQELVVQQNLPVPPFKQWFNSANETVLIFALEMVAWFKQKEAGEEVLRLFEHANEEVRRTAFRVSGEIGLRSALPLLRERYLMESYENKTQILNTFVKIPEEQYLDFLKSVL
ncbi:MAG: HEAT repeat domain-containing protein, partial [Bacteroidales bacterium]